MDLVACDLPSPVGDLWVVASPLGVRAVLWPVERHGRVRLDRVVPGGSVVLDRAVEELTGYFEGSRRSFDVALDPVGTPFQRTVWQALLGIGWGATCSYGALAAALGRPSAVRAVAGAVSRNPISVMVPCHRVVGASGALTGFAGGLDAKRRLLAHEASPTPGMPAAPGASRPHVGLVTTAS